jgi:ATP-binding cassette subfamily B protein/subfamily B ATP-binding cassette protein MsbA
MIGMLQLLIDEITDDTPENQVLIEYSYKSTFRILNILDIVEDVVQQQSQYLSTSATEDNQNDSRQIVPLQIIQEFKIQFNSLLISLRSLADNSFESTENRYEILKQALHLGMDLLNFVENLEDKIHNI